MTYDLNAEGNRQPANSCWRRGKKKQQHYSLLKFSLKLCIFGCEVKNSRLHFKLCQVDWIQPSLNIFCAHVQQLTPFCLEFARFEVVLDHGPGEFVAHSVHNNLLLRHEQMSTCPNLTVCLMPLNNKKFFRRKRNKEKKKKPKCCMSEQHWTSKVWTFLNVAKMAPNCLRTLLLCSLFTALHGQLAGDCKHFRPVLSQCFHQFLLIRTLNNRLTRDVSGHCGGDLNKPPLL